MQQRTTVQRLQYNWLAQIQDYALHWDFEGILAWHPLQRLLHKDPMMTGNAFLLDLLALLVCKAFLRRNLAGNCVFPLETRVDKLEYGNRSHDWVMSCCRSCNSYTIFVLFHMSFAVLMSPSRCAEEPWVCVIQLARKSPALCLELDVNKAWHSYSILVMIASNGGN